MPPFQNNHRNPADNEIRGGSIKNEIDCIIFIGIMRVNRKIKRMYPTVFMSLFKMYGLYIKKRIKNLISDNDIGCILSASYFKMPYLQTGATQEHTMISLWQSFGSLK
jgi:hypothetical protein